MTPCSWSNITSVSTPKPQIFSLQTHSTTSGQPHQQNFFTPQADMIRKLCLVFYNSSIDSFKRGTSHPALSSGSVNPNNSSSISGSSSMKRNNGTVDRVITAGGKQVEDVLLVTNNRFIKEGSRHAQHAEQLTGQQSGQQRFFGSQVSVGS